MRFCSWRATTEGDVTDPSKDSPASRTQLEPTSGRYIGSPNLYGSRSTYPYTYSYPVGAGKPMHMMDQLSSFASPGAAMGTKNGNHSNNNPTAALQSPLAANSALAAGVGGRYHGWCCNTTIRTIIILSLQHVLSEKQ